MFSGASYFDAVFPVSVYSRRYSGGGGGVPDELNFAGGCILNTKRNATPLYGYTQLYCSKNCISLKKLKYTTHYLVIED